MINWQAYLYGTISVTIVSLLSLGGAVIAPLLRSETKYRWLHFFIAMAVATLSSDAILHIIPEILGIHSHSHGNELGHGHEEHEDHDHDHDHNHNHGSLAWYEISKDRLILLRLSLVCLSIYVLYFFEFIIFYRNPQNQSEYENAKSSDSHESNNNEIKISKDEISTTKSVSEESNNNDYSENRLKGGHELVTISETNNEGGTICGLKPRAVIILFGDGVHNFVDGVAIGASFLHSYNLGFITSIAVICHELPHEIGDLAVLVDSGLSMCKALILNLISALTAYAGLYFALLIGENNEVKIILLAITGGMFLYVAWVDMLSHLKHERSSNDHWFLTCSIQFLGFIFGFLLIFSLGWFEGVIKETWL